MQLHYFPGFDGRWNFGDALNPWLWDRVVPGLLDGDDGVVLVGIGTLLNEYVPEARRVVVFGSGAGYGEVPERASEWSVYCVRGPLTAAALGLDGHRVATDPGALAARLYAGSSPRETRRERAYMPHVANANPRLERACADLDLLYIDPTWPVERVFHAIATSGVLVTEALHGAVCADAMRVPWIPVRSTESILAFKWRDWLGSLELPYEPVSVPRPLQAKGRRGPHVSLLRWGSSWRHRRALARALREAVPRLSNEAILDDRLGRLESRLSDLRRDAADGKLD